MNKKIIVIIGIIIAAIIAFVVAIVLTLPQETVDTEEEYAPFEENVLEYKSIIEGWNSNEGISGVIKMWNEEDPTSNRYIEEYRALTPNITSGTGVSNSTYHMQIITAPIMDGYVYIPTNITDDTIVKTKINKDSNTIKYKKEKLTKDYLSNSIEKLETIINNNFGKTDVAKQKIKIKDILKKQKELLNSM